MKYRKEQAERVVREITEAQKIDPLYVEERHVSRHQKSNSGMKNISLVGSAGTMRVEANITIDKKRYCKSFSPSKFEDDVEVAKRAAKQWLDEIRATHPPKGKKRSREKSTKTDAGNE